MSQMYPAARGTTSSQNYVHSQRPLIADEQLKEATGRTRRQWFRALDEAGAQEWDHKRIARWLGGKQDVDAWWAQSVTIEYEDVHGSRASRVRSDDSFEASVSKSVRCTPSQMWPYLDDDDARRLWLDCEFEVRGRTFEKSLRMEASDASHINVTLHPLPPLQNGEPRTRIDVAHSRLPQASDLPETLAFWKAALAALADQFSQPSPNGT